MLNKCFYCHKVIEDNGILHGVDGDVMCSQNCIDKWEKQCEEINEMSDKEFKKWINGK